MPIVKEGNHTFRWTNRRSHITDIFIPGWATNNQIFEHIESPQKNRLDVESLYPQTLEKDLVNIKQKLDITDCNIIAFSMGGFLAVDMINRKRISPKKLTLIGIRKQYPKEEIQAIKKQLQKAPKGHMKKFYRACFHTTKEHDTFKNPKQPLEQLLEGLDYLEHAKITNINHQKIKIIHGTNDKVAPIKEIENLLKSIKKTHIVFKRNKNGHLPISV